MATRSRIGDILLKAKVIDELQLRSALAQHDQWGGRIAKIVAEMGLATEDTIADAIAAAMHLPRIQVGAVKDQQAMARIAEDFCERFAVFPVELKDHNKTLVLAMADPSDLDTADHASGLAHCRVVPVVASEAEIMAAIARAYRGEQPSNIDEDHFSTRRSRPGEEEFDPEDELKITDMAGNTVRKMSPLLTERARAAPTDPVAAWPATIQPTPVPQQAPAPAPHTAGDLLDEILSGLPQAAPAFTAEELQRLETLRQNNDKSARIIRAIADLLKEKGYTTQKELAARIGSAAHSSEQ